MSENLKKYLVNPVFDIISELADKNQRETYVIGGFVRDSLLNRPTKDIDILVVGSGIEAAKELKDKHTSIHKINIFKTFGTAMVYLKNYEIEFVGTRKESYRSDSRKPIVENGTFQDDMNRRDFTINILAISLNKNTYGDLIDVFGGVKDLENKIIRTPLNADITYSDDPLRMMRAIRFASQLNFEIETDSFDAIQRNVERIKIISQERITDEINKIMMSQKPSVGLELLEKSGLLKIILPEISALKGVEVVENKAHKDNFYHTLQVVDKISLQSDNLWLRWAGLLHDIAKPKCKKFIKDIGWTFHGHEFYGKKMVNEIFRRMKLPLNEHLEFVEKLVGLHLRPIALVEDIVSDSAIRRLLFDAGNDIDDLMILCKADITSKNKLKIKKYICNFDKVKIKLLEIEEKDKIRNWKYPIDGEEIMKTFNIGPCKEIGILKNVIKDAILDGVIENNYDEAFAYMIEKAKEIGLKKG